MHDLNLKEYKKWQCPFCESEDIDIGGMVDVHTQVFRDISCNSCGQRWTEYFNLDSVQSPTAPRQYTQEELECIEATKEHIDRVRVFLREVYMHLRSRGRDHDKSKLQDPELPVFAEYTPKLKGLTYGSDEYRECLKGMQTALDHHYKENSHHPEFNKAGIDGMTLIDIMEMLADWRAATERHANGSMDDSLVKNQERFGISDQLANILQNTVDALGWGDKDRD